LTAVHLQAQLAERATTDAERRRALADLKSGLERATRLSEQLLTLARAEPGVGIAERPVASVDLSILAREVVTELAPAAAEKAIDLGLSDVGSVVVRGDKDALRTLLSNLVDNAVRYTPPKGRVDVAVETQGDRVALVVRDNGPGIAPADRARVFDRFYRGQPVHVSAGAPQGASVRGSGLGLAIVKSIAEQHGAEIALSEGLDGRGLSVTVRFPAASA
jgi:two-component system OmpR family sensor kinase